MNADGSGRTVLAAGPEAGQPAWSPDGARIAFSRTARDGSRIWTMGADGSGAHRVTFKTPDGAEESYPAWSPDGKRLAFARTRITSDAFITALISVAADGSDQRTILSARRTQRLLVFSAPAWSLDGTRLLYTRTILDNHSFFRPSLYTIAADGSDRRLVARDAADADWSPDGSRIAFASIRDRNGESCGSDECSYDGEIYTARPDGSDLRRLTDSKAADSEPDWSPDGQWIAFTSDRNYPEFDSLEVYSMRADGSCVTWLTNGTARSTSPAWEPRSGSADPGTCGDAGRPPLAEVDTSRLTKPHSFPLYWLGAVADNGLLFTYIYGGRRGDTDVIYDDCARFDPAQCPGQVELQERSICHQTPFPFAGRRPRIFISRGALVFEPRDPEAGTEVYTGRTAIKIYAAGRPAARRVIDALTPTRGAGGADLPAARIPADYWRRLRRTESAYRRLGSVGAAARSLGISKRGAKRHLGLIRALRKAGAARRVHCKF